MIFPIVTIAVHVGSFWLDREPVTNAELASFEKTHPQWARDHAAPPDAPAYNVNWFEARAFCQWRNGRLPTEAEQERAIELDAVIDLAFEWVEDFTATILDPAECGGAVSSIDPRNYGKYMRAAYRSSLQGSYTTGNLGFRCAYDDSLYDQPLPSISLDVDRGHPTLVSMFYGSCAVACPALIDDIQRVLAEAQAPDARVLLVSFDAARDTPARLAELAREHHLDARWTLVAASEPDARALAATLGFKYRRLPDGNFAHSATVVALDREGRPIARMDRLGDHDSLRAALAR